MVKNIYIVLYCILIVGLFSCSEDKSDESMPLSEIKGAYEPQLNYLNKAIEDDPNDDELLCKRARVYFNMNRRSEALKDIQSAIEIKSGDGEYYLLLAQINFAQGNLFESIKTSEKAESLGLENPELAVLQARVYWATGDTTRSFLYMRKAEQLVPFHSDIKLLQGEQFASKGDTAKAVTYFLSSIRSNRKNASAYSNLIKIYLNKAKDDSALYYTLQAKEIDPRNPDYYFAEGKIFYKKDMKQSAVFSYKNCLKEDSVYAPAIYQLGQLYYREGNPIEAFNYLKRYTALNKDNKEVYRHLISILSEQNKEEATIPYYERLVQLDSNNTGLKYTLQKLYKQYAVVVNNDNATQNSTVISTTVTRDTSRRRTVPLRKDSTAVKPVTLPNSTNSDSIK
jgi:tetratricopeptide (TPR) repeat protein